MRRSLQKGELLEWATRTNEIRQLQDPESADLHLESEQQYKLDEMENVDTQAAAAKGPLRMSITAEKVLAYLVDQKRVTTSRGHHMLHIAAAVEKPHDEVAQALEVLVTLGKAHAVGTELDNRWAATMDPEEPSSTKKKPPSGTTTHTSSDPGPEHIVGGTLDAQSLSPLAKQVHTYLVRTQLISAEAHHIADIAGSVEKSVEEVRQALAELEERDMVQMYMNERFWYTTWPMEQEEEEHHEAGSAPSSATVPSLNLITASPPTEPAPSPPLYEGTDLDLRSGPKEEANEAGSRVSWGENQFHHFEVPTLDSYREQFVSDKDLKDQDRKYLHDEVTAEHDSPKFSQKTTTYQPFRTEQAPSAAETPEIAPLPRLPTFYPREFESNKAPQRSSSPEAHEVPSLNLIAPSPPQRPARTLENNPLEKPLPFDLESSPEALHIYEGDKTPQTSSAAVAQDATDLSDRPPSLTAGPSSSTHDATEHDLETTNIDRFYGPSFLNPLHTRIDKRLVDPQVLTSAGEVFMNLNDAIIVQRKVRADEVERWAAETVRRREREEEVDHIREERDRDRDREEERRRGRRDEDQEMLDRVIAGDMEEAALRRFKDKDDERFV